MRYILISIALSAFSFWQISSVQAAPPVFEVTDRTLTIKTDRFEVDWEDGSLVRVTNLVSNSQILTSSSRSQKRSGLPVGLGSFYQNQSAARAQHAPLSSRPIPFEFKAQHSPDKSSTLDWHYIPNGIQLEYRGLQGDSTAKLIQQFTVENGTGDLIIRQHGSSSKPGTFGISFSVENLNPDLSIIIPFFSGERWGRNIGKGKIQTFAWPRFWSAALLIVEAPENGCFSIWAQDGMMRPKYLHAYNDGARRGFAFESCEEAPYENKFKVESCEWRFNTFGGRLFERNFNTKAAHG